MKILKKIDEISYRNIIAIAFFLTILFALPLMMIIIQERQEIRSKAYEKPTLVIKEEITPGPIPASPPKIGRIFPWVGKIGDVIWIQGENFGNNPVLKRLYIGKIALPDEMITSWRENEIQAYIPDKVEQGGIVQIRIGNHPIASSLPYVIYNKDTKIKLLKRGNILSVVYGASVANAKLWTGDEKIQTEIFEKKLDNTSDEEMMLFDTGGKPILTLLLYDNNGKVLPYYVDPVSFNFL